MQNTLSLSHALTDWYGTQLFFFVHLHNNIYYNLSRNSVFFLHFYFFSFRFCSLQFDMDLRVVAFVVHILMFIQKIYGKMSDWSLRWKAKKLKTKKKIIETKLNMFCVPRRATDWAPFLLDRTIKATEYLVFWLWLYVTEKCVLKNACLLHRRTQIPYPIARNTHTHTRSPESRRTASLHSLHKYQTKTVNIAHPAHNLSF